MSLTVQSGASELAVSIQQPARNADVGTDGVLLFADVDELVRRMGNVYGTRPEQQRLAPPIKKRDVGRVRKDSRIQTGYGREPDEGNLEQLLDRHMALDRSNRAPHLAGIAD